MKVGILVKRNCIKDNKNVKWIILSVVIGLLLYDAVDDKEAEILGECLALIGGVLIILGLE